MVGRSAVLTQRAHVVNHCMHARKHQREMTTAAPTPAAAPPDIYSIISRDLGRGQGRDGVAQAENPRVSIFLTENRL